ncbi:MAG: substrate-binding domain-containing protein [Planctomycetaceae bacterium]|jgi:ABC-type phosphate transport system substrate-binding protein|nr:substrate-binding domain-containing protein [Planctomycetaceae bacterium]
MKCISILVVSSCVAATFIGVNVSSLFGQSVKPKISLEEPQNHSPDDPNFGELLTQKQKLQQSARQKGFERLQEEQKVKEQKFVIDKYVLDTHLKELQSLKPKQMLDGKKIGLDFWNFPEMDGSTSCLNLGMIVASYVLGVPYKWEIVSIDNEEQQEKYPPLFRTYTPLPNENLHSSYSSNTLSGIELKVVTDVEKTTFRQRNIFRQYFGQFQGTHKSYLALIGKAKENNPNTPNRSYNNYPRIPGSSNYSVQPDKNGRYPTIDPSVTPDTQGRFAFPQSEILLVARSLSEDEMRALKLADIALEFHPIALDGFIFVVNRTNPVEGLTLEQIQSIYASSQPKYWKDFGGSKDQIKILERNHNSGSRELMDQLVVTPEALQKYRDGATSPIDEQQSQSLYQHSSPPPSLKKRDNESFRDSRPVFGMSGGGMKFILNGLHEDRNSIGYSVYHFEHFVFRVPESRVLAVNGVFPNYESIRTKKYPLIYEVYVVTRKGIANDSPAAKLRDWLLSDDGQRAIRESGYVPINPKIASE